MDFLPLYALIETATKSDLGLREAMQQVADECARQQPHDDWNQLLGLVFEKDCEQLKLWMGRLIAESPLPPEATGLWFGLFNPVDDDGGTIADLRVSAGVYDPEDIEWQDSPIWEPDGRCANSPLLADLYRIAYREGGLGNDAEWPLALAYACLVVRDLAREHATALGTPERVLYAGFDSGDLLCIGALTPTGLRFSADSEILE